MRRKDAGRKAGRCYSGGSVIELLSSPAPDDTVSLGDMTKAELLAYAEEHGISGVSSSMLKADIYAAIVAAIGE